MKFIDLTGQRFGRLVAKERINNNKSRHSRWLCECDCENIKIIREDNLVGGYIKSCGCLRKEIAKSSHLTHGQSKTKTYISWNSMVQRCVNVNDPSYKDYGGRKIKVCCRWSNKNPKGFQNFLEDMGERPSGYEIDRIDNNKGYYKSNCKWSTRKEQMNNVRSNHLIAYKNKNQCLSALANEHNISPQLLGQRLKRGLSIEEALTIPVKIYRRRK